MIAGILIRVSSFAAVGFLAFFQASVVAQPPAVHPANISTRLAVARVTAS
jgi:hypothetical protein